MSGFLSEHLLRDRIAASRALANEATNTADRLMYLDLMKRTDADLRDLRRQACGGGR